MKTENRVDRALMMGRAAALVAVTLPASFALACGGAPPDVEPAVARAAPTTTTVAREDFAPAIATARARLRETALLTAGLAVAIYEDGQPVWEEGIGLADVESGTPVDPAATRFRIYSVVKPMTAVAALRLAEAGRLDPQAPIQRYLPSYPEHSSPITALQLGTHTSGIRHYANEAEAHSTRHCETVEDALPIFADDPLVLPPGQGRAYSSWGFVLLSAVVSAADGSPFPEAIRTLVSEPAGMTDLALDDARQDLPSRASPYQGVDGRLRVADRVDNTCKWGAGGFVATAADVARFGSALLGGALVSDASREMFLRGGDAYTAQGSGIGGTAALRVDAASGLAIALLANTSGDELTDELSDALEDVHRAFAAPAAESPTPRRAPVPSRDP